MGDLARIEGFCELSTTNLTFKRDVSKEEWMDVFKALKQVEGCVQFWIGDCLAYRQQKWGMYDDIAEETGYDKQALRDIKYVAQNVESSRRNDNSLLRNNRWLFCCALLLCDGHIGKVPFSYLTTCRVLCSVLSIVDRTGK